MNVLLLLNRDEEDEANVDTDWIMTIRQADQDLKKQLQNGDKMPDQVNTRNISTVQTTCHKKTIAWRHIENLEAYKQSILWG